MGLPPKSAVETERELARLIREGLGENPSAITMHLWIARAMTRMLHHTGKSPLVPEMLDLVAQSRISYLPLWDCEAELVAGSVARLDSALDPGNYNTGEAWRQDLALLFAAAVQVYYLQSKGARGVIVLPVRTATLADDACVELYGAFLMRLPESVAESLILDVRGLGPRNAPPAIADAVHTLSNSVHRFIFTAAPGEYPDFRAAFPVMHGMAFCLGQAAAPVAEQGRLIRRFAAHCRRLQLKSFLHGVRDPRAFAAARRLGYTCISGTVLHAAQAAAFARKSPARTVI